MVNPLKNKQELTYEPVHEDLDFLAQVVRFVAVHTAVPYISTAGFEPEPCFQTPKSKPPGLRENFKER
jgi:hypothetical protein